MPTEPRHASVLFADIAGFTAISEQLDPEAVTETINRFFECIEAIVIARGGEVAQYLGDCALALFPAAGDPAGAAVRAVEAAIDIRDSIERVRRELRMPETLGVHTGIASGTAIAGELGIEHPRRIIGGEAVVRAAALEDLSETGQILVDEVTRRLTAGVFHFGPAGALPAGTGAPEHGASAVLGIADVRGRIRRRSERRHAAVLFARLADLTRLADAGAAAGEHRPLAEAVAAFEAVVRAHGGVVDKYNGDSLMALFGVPNAIENAAQEAVNAAIELRNRVHALAAAVPLELAIGVNAGLMIAGEIGGRVRRDYTVMGDAVNLAARLKERAAAGAIWVGSEVYRQTREVFAYRALEPIRLKGKADPVPIYEVLSEHEQVHRTKGGAGARLSSALVGRDREVVQLRDAVAALVQGRGGAVSIVGDAGIGKSRLLAELLTDERLAPATILEGRATAMGRNLSYHPFVDLLRRWAGVSDVADDADVRAAFSSAVAAVMGEEEAAETWPLLATLMGIELDGAEAARIAGIDGEALERLIAKSLRDLLEALAGSAPVVVVFEDLHWADQSSIRLLAAVLRLVTEHPILILQLFRSEFRDTAEQFLAEGLETPADWTREIVLAPLTEQQSRVLIESLLRIDDLPLAARRLITQKAEGNPFFIEEVLRSLIDQGAVELRGGRYKFTARLESVVIPGTVQEVILSRVDRLDDPTRHLLQVASVVGRSFHRGLIGEILRRQGQVHDQIDAELDALTAKQLLAPRPTRWTVAVGARGAAEELEYLFTHALAQQTIYESLLQKTRTEFHAVVAAAIESVFADRLADFFGMLAYHYGRAEELPKAEEYLFKAGEVAARSAASREALTFFQEASRLYLLLHPDGGELQKRMLLEKKIAMALWNIGDLSDSIEHFDKTLEYLGERVPSRALATNVRFAGDFAALLFRLYRGPAGDGRDLDRVREIVSVSYMKGRAQTTSDPVRVFMDSVHGMRWLNRSDPTRIDQAAGMYATMAAFLAYSGLGASLGVSFALSRRCLALAQRVVRPGNVFDAFSFRGMRFVAEYLAGNWARLEPIDDELIATALQQGLFWDVQAYLNLDGDRLSRQGDFAPAQKRAQQLQDMADTYGYEFAQTAHDGAAASGLLEQRRLAEALAASEHYYQSRHEPPLTLLALSRMAKVNLLLDQRDTAAALLAEAAELLRRARTIPAWHLNSYEVARLLHDVMALERAHADGASGATRHALAAQAKHSMRGALGVGAKVRTQRTEIFQLAGRVCWALRRHGKARSWWVASIREGLHLGARPELARTYLAAGTRLAAHHRPLTIEGLDADALVKRAEQLFIELDLQHDLQQLAGSARAA